MNDDRKKIDCADRADRATLARILAEQSYSVRIGREKRGKGNVYTYFVEYWRETQ